MDSNSSLGFDLNSQKGVAVLLASLRASDLAGREKNEIRDLIFSYTNGGGDVSIRIALEQKLRSHNIKPVAVGNGKTTEAKLPPAPALPFGSSRPAPVFKVPVISSVTKDATVNSMPEIKKTEKEPVINSEPKIAPEPAPTIVQSNPTSNTSNPSPSAQPDAVKQVEAEKNNQRPVPPPPPPPTPGSSLSSVANADRYLNRIREIKSAVNNKVGNPVNLVDIDNQIGREYMNALLEAMKRLSGGASGQMELAMKRLELAFVSVEKAVEGHKSSVATPREQKSEPVSVDKAPVLGNNFSTPVRSESNIPTPTPIPAPTPTPIPAQNNTKPTIQAQANDEQKKTDPEPNSWQLARDNAATHAVDTAAKVESPTQGYQAKSILVEERLATPADLPLRAASDTSDSTDPLYSNEVNVGLEQLLSDWSLFKKSGLFGTGPKGKDHPLFVKVAGLQIPLLLAGRFEGSTQEIKQSITDYMNGWRYEQGIIYEKGETFERYLRRVIRLILDLQKKRIPS